VICKVSSSSSTLLLFFLTRCPSCFSGGMIFVNFVATGEGEHKSPNGRQADENDWSKPESQSQYHKDTLVLIAKDVETLETTRAESTRVSGWVSGWVSGFDHVSGLDLKMLKTYSLVDASIPHYIPHKAFSTQGGAFLQRRN
jgi:hypothetical protein